MAGFNADEYINVAERISQFYEKYPDGRLCTLSYNVHEVAGKAFVAVTAYAYRDPADEHPGVGTAWEPVPGPTQFTRDSELMNAETAAWGRAIVSLGFETKHIASREEVRNRSGNRDEPSTNGSGPAVSDDELRRLRALTRPSEDGEVPEIEESRVLELLKDDTAFKGMDAMRKAIRRWATVNSIEGNAVDALIEAAKKVPA